MAERLLEFEGADWRPNIIMVGLGGVNALTGEAWNETPVGDPQNYMVIPDQPWIDGIVAETGIIRQFVAMPLGSGYTVEKQVTGNEDTGGLQLAVFDPKPGRFPDQPPWMEGA